MNVAKLEKIVEDEGVSFPAEWYVLSDADHFWMKWRLKTLLNLFHDLQIPRNQDLKALDIGCGIGTFAKQIEENTKWKVDGIDLHDFPVEKVWSCEGKFKRKNIFEATKEELEQYDAVFLMDVLEHIDDPKTFLNQSSKFLKKGGFLITNVPAFSLLYSKYDVIVGHRTRYQKVKLFSLHQRTDIRLLQMRYWGLLTFPILILRKLYLNFFSNDANIVQKGFQPPNKISDIILNALMKIETKAIKNPIVGTSLMSIGVKK